MKVPSFHVFFFSSQRGLLEELATRFCAADGVCLSVLHKQCNNVVVSHHPPPGRLDQCIQVSRKHGGMASSIVRLRREGQQNTHDIPSVQQQKRERIIHPCDISVGGGLVGWHPSSPVTTSVSRLQTHEGIQRTNER